MTVNILCYRCVIFSLIIYVYFVQFLKYLSFKFSKFVSSRWIIVLKIAGQIGILASLSSRTNRHLTNSSSRTGRHPTNSSSRTGRHLTNSSSRTGRHLTNSSSRTCRHLTNSSTSASDQLVKQGRSASDQLVKQTSSHLINLSSLSLIRARGWIRTDHDQNKTNIVGFSSMYLCSTPYCRCQVTHFVAMPTVALFFGNLIEPVNCWARVWDADATLNQHRINVS